jgi:hypothetical protein
VNSDGEPYVDFVLVADRAEGINGKLYLMGGAWDRLYVVDFGQPVSFSIAAGVVVPWTATNNEHRVVIELTNEDGVAIEPRLEVGIRLGRPADAIPGQSFRAIVTALGVYRLSGPGAYALTASIRDTDPRRAVFYAVQSSTPR